MSIIELTPLDSPITKEVSIPGSLSHTIRALNLGVMTDKPVTLINPLDSDDVRAMISCLKTLGIDLAVSGNKVKILNSIRDLPTPTKKTLTDYGEVDFVCDINLSGRSARTILPLLCITPGTKILTASKPFLKRPMGPQVEGLIALGARIEYLGEEGKLPLKITSSKLNSGIIRIPGNISSQFFAGILMIAPVINGVEIEVEGDLVSKPYIDITLEIMENFGVKTKNYNYQRFLVEPNQKYQCQEYKIEGDYSSAAYIGGIAALTKSKILLKNLSKDSLQGDRFIFEILENMGNDLKWLDQGLEITGKELKSVDINMEKAIDQPPTISVLAAFAKGKSRITGIEILKYKETDRLQAIINELSKMGIKTDSDGTYLEIEGGDPKSAMIDTYNDHRIAMSFAIAGSKIPGMKIKNPEVVSKSFPAFWKILENLGIGVLNSP